MNAWLKRSALVLPTAALVLVAGCSRPLKEQVQGKWRQVNAGTELTFLKDGTVSGSIGGPFQVNGTYTTPDEQHLKIQPSGLLGNLAGPQVWEARLKDGRLLLTVNGTTQEFQRAESGA